MGLVACLSCDVLPSLCSVINGGVRAVVTARCGERAAGRGTSPPVSSCSDFSAPCVLSPFSRVRLLVTPWTAAHQATLSIGCSRQEYWSGLPCPLPGDLPSPGIEPTSLTSRPLAGGFFTTSTTWKASFSTFPPALLSPS